MRREMAFWFGETDVVPVAVFRIALGLLSFNWFWQLYPNLTQFYTDEGIFPRSSQVLFFPRHLTLLNAAGEWWQVAFFWLVALAVALALAIGLHSRTAAFVTFLMLGSFSLRNPLIGDASDQIFRASAFWLTFTAAGDRYSVDAWLRARRGDPASGRGSALPIRILELQFAWIYLATGLEKMGGGLWRDGLAVFYSIQLEHTFARPWSATLAQNLELTQLATQLTLLVELAFLPLAFLPYMHRVGRTIAVLTAAGLHLSILLLMNVGNFPLIMLAGLIPFLQPGWVARIIRLPRALAGVTAAPVTSASRLATTTGLSAARSVGLVALAFLVFSTSLPADIALPRSDPIDRVLQYANLLQKWNMFSPDPPTSDGWMRIPAVLEDGTQIDLATGRVPSDEPVYADPLYSRWTKVTEWLASAANAAYREEYSRMYCRLRNLHLQPGQSPIVSLDLVYYERKVPPPGGEQEPARPILLNSHHC